MPTRTLYALLLLLSMASACSRKRAPGPIDVGRTTSARQAALTRLFVDNQTVRDLRIAFRLAAEPGGAVIVGRAPPRALVRLAPVAAGEPIILYAIDMKGETYELTPRTLLPDSTFTWLIPHDAIFRLQGAQ
jgi:hypothetical protein